VGFPFNICGTAEASNFKFGMQLRLVNAKAHRKNHNQRKAWAWFWARSAPIYLVCLFNTSAVAALSS